MLIADMADPFDSPDYIYELKVDGERCIAYLDPGSGTDLRNKRNMPQTRFVLGRALELGHKVIVVINKIDRPDQRIYEVIDEVLELLLDLDATDEQLDSPMRS